MVNGWLKEYRGVRMLAHVLLEIGRVQTKRPEGPVGRAFQMENEVRANPTMKGTA